MKNTSVGNEVEISIKLKSPMAPDFGNKITADLALNALFHGKGVVR